VLVRKPPRRPGRHCIRLRPGLHQRSEFADTPFGEIGEGSPQVRPHRSTGLNSWTVSQDRATTGSVIAWLTWAFRLSQKTTSGPAEPLMGGV
jgi:hypothetical protein